MKSRDPMKLKKLVYKFRIKFSHGEITGRQKCNTVSFTDSLKVSVKNAFPV